jgi:hypothetical protein
MVHCAACILHADSSHSWHCAVVHASMLVSTTELAAPCAACLQELPSRLFPSTAPAQLQCLSFSLL